MSRRVAIALLVVAGCYRPSAKPGAPCSADLTCPSGEVCDLTQSPPTCELELGADAGGHVSDAGGDGGADANAGPPCGTHPACGPTEPIRDNGTCRACGADTDCPSNACDEYRGTCIAETAAIYVATTGNDSGTCTKANPCATLSAGVAHLSPSREFIAVAKGKYMDAVTLTGANATISGASWDANATTVSYKLTSGHPDLVDVTSSNLTIETMTFSGGNGDCLHVTGSTVSLQAAAFANSGGSGVNASNATVVTGGLGASGNGGNGVTLSAVALQMDGAYIDGNGGRALSLSSSNYTVTNSIFTSNNAGGISITNPSNPAIFEFNTVVNNNSGGGANSGITSNSVIKVSDSIFDGNGTPPQVTTNVGVTYSLFHDPDVAPSGTGNITGDPLFNLFPYDLELKNNLSAAHDTADPNATMDHDFDYNPRPSHGRRDIGCFEFQD